VPGAHRAIRSLSAHATASSGGAANARSRSACALYSRHAPRGNGAATVGTDELGAVARGATSFACGGVDLFVVPHALASIPSAHAAERNELVTWFRMGRFMLASTTWQRSESYVRCGGNEGPVAIGILPSTARLSDLERASGRRSRTTRTPLRRMRKARDSKLRKQGSDDSASRSRRQ